jgi:hypothetical protein
VKQWTKPELVAQLHAISEMGWIESERGANDGAIGNTLEDLLGIEENNLPLPNSGEWELKTKRFGSASLTSLVHPEPSPRAMRLVPQLMLPKYGWPHQKAGDRYPETELSFRQTLTMNQRTDRGFTFKRDDDNERLVVSFDSTAVDERHSNWLKSVKKRVGLDELDPMPYWGYSDLEHTLGTKLKNAFFVEAQVKRIDGVEHFWFRQARMLAGFDFSKFLAIAETGKVKIDFDARTGHNHGTKFRVTADALPDLYDTNTLLFSHAAEE